MAPFGKHSGLWALWLCFVLCGAGAKLCGHSSERNYPKKEHTIFQRTFGASGAIDVVRIFIDPDKLDADELRRGQRLYVSLTAVCGQAFTKEAILPVKRRSGYLTPKGVVAHETTLRATDNTTATGMFSHSYSFPASPVLGVWSAVVNYGFRLSQETNITFELKEYVPPSFSAKITAPGVILPDSDVTVTVEAKYPYGEPVQGSVTCQFKTRDINTGAVQPYQGAESVTKELVHGNATFLLPKRGRWGQYLHTAHLFSRLVVEAEVLDKATGERVTAEDDSAVYAQSPYRVSFRRTDPNFRPGGPKVVLADVTYANGQPAANVPCTVKAESADGFNVPVDPDVETLLPSEPGRQAVGHVMMQAFRSEINAVLFLESADGGKVVKVGEVISIRAGIHPPTPSPAYYIVTHNGQVKHFGELHQDQQPGSSYRFAQFPVTADMSPSVRVLAYAFHEGHLLADTVVIEVEEACLEKAAITVETDFNSERPGANGSVKIIGTSGTRVGILGINKQQSPDVIQEDTSCRPLSRRRSSLRRLKRSVQYEAAVVAFLDECCSLGRRPDRAGRSCLVRADIVRRYISGQKGEQCADAYRRCCSRAFGVVRPDFDAGLPGPLPNRDVPLFSRPANVPDDSEIDGRIGPNPPFKTCVECTAEI
ncbi:hypothetical protein MTO96_024046 [Rhipicephalus appendiculatus]